MLKQVLEPNIACYYEKTANVLNDYEAESVPVDTDTCNIWVT